MSSESTPSSSLAPTNLSTITSSFFSILQNRNIIHIVCEVVIIGITSYYFYKKTNTLSNQIKILEAKIEQLENESKKQKVFLDEKLAEIISAVNSHMMSQMYQPQHIQSPPPPQPPVQRKSQMAPTHISHPPPTPQPPSPPQPQIQPQPQSHTQNVHIQQNQQNTNQQTPKQPSNEIAISLPASPAVTPTELKSKTTDPTMVVMEVVVSHSPPSVPKNKIQIEEYNDDDNGNGNGDEDLDAELADEGLLDELNS